MKKIIITSGGTREYIDDVRVLTNISTGKLGAVIAEKFCEESKFDLEKVPSAITKLAKEDVHIYYVHTKGSVLPLINGNRNQFITLIEIKDVKELQSTLKELVPSCDVIIHAMAVSDFTFKTKDSVKLKSDDTKGFIKYLKKNIKKNPKIISKIKKWNPSIVLVGFKFEVGLSTKKLFKTAISSMKSNNADYVIANDKKEMKENNNHIAYIIHNEKGYEKCEGKEDIATKLKTLLHV